MAAKKRPTKKRSRATISRNATAREILDALDKWFTEGWSNKDDPQPEREALWDVLTALRGPDDSDVLLKEHTTEIIRSHAFPLIAKRIHSETGVWAPAFFAPPSRGLHEIKIRTTSAALPSSSTHFNRHVKDAHAALVKMKK